MSSFEMQKDIKESLASIYLEKPKIESPLKSFSLRKNIFFLAFILIVFSIIGVLLILLLNI